MTSKGATDLGSTPPPGSAPPPSSGTGLPRLEKYELLEEIGHGGMATVYRARDPRLGREVAVKVIHKHLRENAEVATRFLAEARAAAKLRHPGIVEVFDVSSEEDAERYLVVELIRGTTFRKVLQQHREMPAEVGAAIALEVCEALEHAHESGIIHRDIKPENVLVELPSDRAAASGKSVVSRPTPTDDLPRSSKDGKKPRGADAGVIVKITDFGIAKVLDAQGVTSTGQVLGSPAHMAPEQIEGGEVDARTDVFAVGVLLYEAMVGHLPFEGKNPAQVLRKVLDGVYVPADRERPTVGGRWAKIVAEALARDAAERTASPGALAQAIRNELAALGIDDPKAEIAAYFADPDGYRAELTKRLVPRLVARGEAARKSGDVPGAAADFNRALALAPDDLSILKRLTSLTSSQSRKLLAKRIAMIAGGTAAAALLTFGVTRLVRSLGQASAGENTAAPGRPAASAEVAPPPITASPERSSTAALPSASARTKDASRDEPKPKATSVAVAPRTPGSSKPAAGSATRKVRFSIIPVGAKLVLDGQDVGSWTGRVFELELGPHRAEVSIEDKCCKSPKTEGFAVTAPRADKPDEVQVVSISLDLNPASATLVGAPPNAQVSCGNFSLVTGATASNVKLSRPVQTISCWFTPPSGKQFKSSVTLRAGEANEIAWREPPPDAP